MKKLICLTIVLLLVVSLFAACNQKPSAQENEQSALQDSVFDADPTEAETQPPAEEADTQPSATEAETTAPTQSALESADTLFDNIEATEPVKENATEPTKPANQEATKPSTEPTEAPSQPSTDPTEEDKPMDYLTFQAMSGAEQRAFQESFESLDAFFEWYNDAKEAYEKANPPIEVGGNGVIDMEDLVGGNG